MGLRAALLNPLGLSLLFASALLIAVISALGLADSAKQGPALLIVPGLVAYGATIVVYLWPLPEPQRRLVSIRHDIQARLNELRSADARDRSPLIPVVAEAARQMDRELLPTFHKIVARHDTLSRQLDHYATGRARPPDAAILERLRRIHARQLEAIEICLQQAANAYAALLLLLQESSESEVAEGAKMWATDLLDMYDNLAEVLSGDDPYEQAFSRLRASGDGREVLPLLNAALAQLEPAAPEPPPAMPAVPPETPTAAPPVDAPSAARPSFMPVYPNGLTPREVEVLALVAAGKTSKEIADELVVTIATVSRHIANVYGKIDARGRADATRYALTHGIVWPNVSARRGPVPQEAEVMRLLAEGVTPDQIAVKLGLGVSVVAETIARAYARIAERRATQF